MSVSHRRSEKTFEFEIEGVTPPPPPPPIPLWKIALAVLGIFGAGATSVAVGRVVKK